MFAEDLSLLRANLLAGLAAPSQAEADAALAGLTPAGDWPDLDYRHDERADWVPRYHIERARVLALRWRATRDERLLDAVRSALAGWIRLDPVCPNWWHNQIGNPRVLGETLLVVREHLSPALLATLRPLLDRARRDVVWSPDELVPMRWTGANRLWISANRLLAGAIFGDEALIAEAVADALTEIRVSSATEEGVQIDGSFHQHGPLLYNGGYGLSYLLECMFFLAAAQGTRWQPASGYHRLLADYLLDGTRWMLRGDDIDFGCQDREMTRPWVSIKPYAAPAAFLAAAGLPRADELRDFAAAAARADAPGAITGNRMFFRSDFMVQQSASAAVSVRMHSSRTVRAECCNNEGRLSHHVADGVMSLRRSGAEYRDIFPVWDWERLPGATIVQNLPGKTPESVRARGRSPSVGGVSDGRFGACTQLLDTDALVARKSWFFGPEGVVCLGAGIRGLGPGRVVTTLDQSLAQGPVEWSDGSAPRAVVAASPAARHALRAARWLRHGAWGFVFPKPSDVSLELGPRSGAWSDVGAGSSAPLSREVFLAALDHGDAPAAADYAYAILPDADRARLDAAVARPSWQILNNSPRLQAVWREDVGLLQAFFFGGAGRLAWGAGWLLEVDRECAVMLARDASTGAWHLDVADIRQDGGTITVTLSGPVSEFTPQLVRTVTCQTGDHAGRSMLVF